MVEVSRKFFESENIRILRNVAQIKRVERKCTQTQREGRSYKFARAKFKENPWVCGKLEEILCIKVMIAVSRDCHGLESNPLQLAKRLSLSAAA